MSSNLYSTLGIPKSSTHQEIQAAYRRAAMKAHPDREGGSEEAFKAVQQAGDILLDKDKRAEYDSTGNIPGKEPSMRDRAQAMLVDVMGRLGEPDFHKVLKDIKRDLLGDKSNLQSELNRAKKDLDKFEKSLLQFKDNELSGGILELAGMRRASLDAIVKQREDALAFMDETMKLLEPIAPNLHPAQDFSGVEALINGQSPIGRRHYNPY